MRVKEQNRGVIPKDWREVRNPSTHTKDGELTEKAHAYIEISSRKQAKWFTSINNVNIGQIFGGIGDGKRKKSVF